MSGRSPTGSWKRSPAASSRKWRSDYSLVERARLARHRAQDQRPAASLSGLAGAFQADVRRIDEILAPHGARLMPTGMHPWMDPQRETHLWPHEYSPVYEAFDRIFSCKGHGWSNLQSAHLNLPFQGDRRIRPAARRDPARAAAPAGAGRDVTGGRGPADRIPRPAPRGVPAERRPSTVCERCHRPGAGLLPRRLRDPDPATDLP